MILKAEIKPSEIETKNLTNLFVKYKFKNFKANLFKIFNLTKGNSPYGLSLI